MPKAEAAKSTAPQRNAPASPPKHDAPALAIVAGRSHDVGSWRRPSKLSPAKAVTSHPDTKKQSHMPVQQPTRSRKLLAVSNKLSFKDVAARNTEHQIDEQAEAITAPTTLALAATVSEATDSSTRGVSEPSTPERTKRSATNITTPDKSTAAHWLAGELAEHEPAGELAWGEEEAVHANDAVYVPLEMYLSEMDAKAIVQEQLEYYFSVENLCKDIFLRKHMVCASISYGWYSGMRPHVPVVVIRG